MQALKNYFFLFYLSVLLSSCGWSNLNVFPLQQDIDLGKSFSEELKSEHKGTLLDENKYPQQYAYLNKIKNKILASGNVEHQKDFEWKLFILNDDSIQNAFCTPGGYIFVYTGLMKFLESEDQLAGVMAHEIAHADLRHSTQQFTQNLGLKLLLYLIGLGGDLSGAAIEGLGGLTFSRSHETEADLKGMEYLEGTDYNPMGVAYFFERMSEKGESLNALEFLSTHPNPEDRIEELNKNWEKKGKPTGKNYKEEYQEFLKLLNQKNN